MLGKPSMCYIKGVLYVFCVLKPTKRADFSTISGFVNLLMPSRTSRRRPILPAGSADQRDHANRQVKCGAAVRIISESQKGIPWERDYRCT